MTAQKDLANLLLSLFSADELRRWLRYLPGGDGLSGRLPGVNASPASLASEAVAELEREGMIDEGFWGRLIEERPRRKGDIDKVRGQFAAVATAPVPAAPVATVANAAKCTVLLVSASPNGEVRLRVDKEFRDVMAKMRGSEHRDHFTFVQQQAARLEDLGTALLLHQPNVLHISAHGEADGSLLLEGEGDTPQVVTRKQLIRTLAGVDDLRLVVLNACHSEAVARELPAVSGLAIGMSDAVADKAAISFAVAFYEALGFGRSVDTSFQIALGRLSDLDDENPQLFPPADQDPENRRKARLIKV